MARQPACRIVTRDKYGWGGEEKGHGPAGENCRSRQVVGLGQVGNAHSGRHCWTASRAVEEPHGGCHGGPRSTVYLATRLRMHHKQGRSTQGPRGRVRWGGSGQAAQGRGGRGGDARPAQGRCAQGGDKRRAGTRRHGRTWCFFFLLGVRQGPPRSGSGCNLGPRQARCAAGGPRRPQPCSGPNVRRLPVRGSGSTGWTRAGASRFSRTHDDGPNRSSGVRGRSGDRNVRICRQLAQR